MKLLISAYTDYQHLKPQVLLCRLALTLTRVMASHSDLYTHMTVLVALDMVEVMTGDRRALNRHVDMSIYGSTKHKKTELRGAPQHVLSTGM